MKRLFFIILLLGIPFSGVHAQASDMHVAGWVPWFALESGMERAEAHFDELDTAYLFVYEAVAADIISERADLRIEEWDDFLAAAREANVELIPTISWFIGEAIHETLSDPELRTEHVETLVALVEENDYDGIDIDYEQKRAETIDHFSAFLEELNDALGEKVLVCSIEARTPPESLYRDIPDNIEYANDFEAINEHCDRVQLMAYDQQRADIKLNDAKKGLPYAPVADRDWVEKVITLALEDIDPEKIMLGAATYGRAWDVAVSPAWYRDYTSVASLNHPRILELSEKYDTPLGKTLGGEAAISYFPEDSVYTLLNQLPTLPGTPPGYEAAIKALLFATLTGMEVEVRFVTWSDAGAIEDKVDLAKRHGLKGVSLFKIDGEEDPAIWNLF